MRYLKSDMFHVFAIYFGCFRLLLDRFSFALDNSPDVSKPGLDTNALQLGVSRSDRSMPLFTTPNHKQAREPLLETSRMSRSAPSLDFLVTPAATLSDIRPAIPSSVTSNVTRQQQICHQQAQLLIALQRTRQFEQSSTSQTRGWVRKLDDVDTGEDSSAVDMHRLSLDSDLEDDDGKYIWDYYYVLLFP